MTVQPNKGAAAIAGTRKALETAGFTRNPSRTQSSSFWLVR